ncbi:TetR/AcrR family transcriptional regulator [Lactiplantibacillus mudanjiangensis]|uniref:Transcriptional regulator [Lactobacillus ginsenosidimutans] n=1 Tax=Lactiplantibacillus mudanjiangensis TaxID=1296538 RepID=A0A660DY12_9LACO|nr:TetR/AcrR family transcriptional regulator [Lactiplantibacillus mudanjiangensis]VDG19674.1 transcriptional regulator [Lactobacillus ginsenosidimutans] [Lactiplantibacillus mudanjiangensis]VDG24956.1 transcriptional regulator [Lactobacillus ginsenosidimutans] [Lactiplantibacillus mudanjiangensis]VDG28160.1 transcriptional regulator [Lactobacillus ginsenosidimutans] [Lactiplantibacillus mudanjiangensis]VDG31118.1 transcriptional regulator [Lactobacillus ginsenosidimutans] [Lactiplantibacillus 
MPSTTRRAIITTAESLIQQTGKADVTLSQIATALGMTHAALYKHFRNKQALWEAVATRWFQREILDALPIYTSGSTHEQLHTWLWALVNAKKRTYQNNPQMFALNTQYLDNNPAALRRVLQPAYQNVDILLAYHDAHYERAEAVIAAFAIFMLPTFKETWLDDDYQDRFERTWQLIEPGL